MMSSRAAVALFLQAFLFASCYANVNLAQYLQGLEAVQIALGKEMDKACPVDGIGPDYSAAPGELNWQYHNERLCHGFIVVHSATTHKVIDGIWAQENQHGDVTEVHIGRNLDVPGYPRRYYGGTYLPQENGPWDYRPSTNVSSDEPFQLVNALKQLTPVDDAPESVTQFFDNHIFKLFVRDVYYKSKWGQSYNDREDINFRERRTVHRMLHPSRWQRFLRWLKKHWTRLRQWWKK